MTLFNKMDTLRDIFGDKNLVLEKNRVVSGGISYPVIDEVVVLSPPETQTPFVRRNLETRSSGKNAADFAEDIQFSFGEEWKEYADILPEHSREFQKYFDIVNLDEMKNLRVADLGCGMGRWSHFLVGKCREIVLVDFSDAIFTARRNLKNCSDALFFMGDITRLPFRKDFADFSFSLGVLHHLPVPCLEALRGLKDASPRILVYLYYSLDNRPAYFRALLAAVTFVRRRLNGIRRPLFRKIFSKMGAVLIYKPLVILGEILNPLGLSGYVPLYDSYRGKSLTRIEQDVYDRFFTRIEQRVSRRDIESLKDTFSRVAISEDHPFWHFLCVR